MKTKLYFLIFLFFTFQLGISQSKILFVGGGSEIEGSVDESLWNLLDIIGYELTYVDDDNLGDFVNNFTDYDVVYFSETPSSSKVFPFKDAGFPIPAVSEEGAGPRTERWDLITNDDYYDRVPSGDTTGAYLDIIDNSHYITRIYDQGELVRWTLGDQVDMNDIRSNVIDFSMDIPNAVALANSYYAEITDKSQLWAIPENSSPLSERFVYFGTDADGIGELGSNDYYKIVLRSLEWAMGMEKDSDSEGKLLFVGGSSEIEGSVDENLWNLLDIVGYELTYVDDDNLGDYVNSFTDFDVIYFSETPSSSKVFPFKDAGFPLPCVSEEGAGPRTERWDLITNDDYYDRVPSGDTTGAYLEILDNTHYITEIYDQGELVRWTLGDQVDMNDIRSNVIDFSIDIPNAVALANSYYAEITDKSQLWAIPENTPPLSERFVYFGTDADGIGELGSNDYYKIVLRSLEWVMGKDQNTGIPGYKNVLNPVKVYPNPVSDILNISIDIEQPESVKVTLFNLLGQEVFIPSSEYYVNEGDDLVRVDLSKLDKGMYIYRLEMDNKYYSGKIQVVK